MWWQRPPPGCSLLEKVAAESSLFPMCIETDTQTMVWSLHYYNIKLWSTWPGSEELRP